MDKKLGTFMKKNQFFVILILITIMLPNAAYAGLSSERTGTVIPERLTPMFTPKTYLLPESTGGPRGILFVNKGNSIFFDNMENGIGSWTTTGFWHLQANPQNIAVFHVGTSSPDDPPNDINPDLVTLAGLDSNGEAWLPTAYSGNNVLWYGVAANGTFIDDPFDLSIQAAKNGGRSTQQNAGELISPNIFIPDTADAFLTFATWWEIEGVDVHVFDMMYVMISTDGGSTFTELGTLNPINDVSNLPEQNYSSGGSNTAPIWIQPIFDLSNYTGNTVKIKFKFETRDQLYNGFRGWIIDDVAVYAESVPSPICSSVSPPCIIPAEIPETIVNIYGSNFADGATITVDGSPVSETSIIASHHIQILLPASLPIGVYDITVMNPDQQSCTMPNAIEVSEICECPEDDTGALDIQGANKTDGTVSIPVRIQNAPNAVSSLGFEVVYPASILTYTGFTEGPCVEGWTLFNVTSPEPGIVRVGGLTTGNGIAAGESCYVVYLEFEIDPECDSVSPLDLQELKDDISGWSTSHGCFDCTRCSCDINGDDEITPGDALCAFQKYMGVCPTNCGPCDEICCDVNADDECTPADALEIFREYMGEPSVCSSPQV